MTPAPLSLSAVALAAFAAAVAGHSSLADFVRCSQSMVLLVVATAASGSCPVPCRNKCLVPVSVDLFLLLDGDLGHFWIDVAHVACAFCSWTWFGSTWKGLVATGSLAATVGRLGAVPLDCARMCDPWHSASVAGRLDKTLPCVSAAGGSLRIAMVHWSPLFL